MKLAVALCLALAGAAGLARAGAQESRLRWARLRAEGPLDGALLDCGAGGELLLRGRLAEGERRLVELPLPSAPGGAAVEPVMATPAPGPDSGGVRFEAWIDDDSGARLAALPSGLRSRPRPALPGSLEQAVPLSVLLLLAAAFVTTLALRRRSLAMLGSALAWSAAVLVLLARGEPPRDGIRVLEGEEGTGVWLAVDVVAERAQLGPDRPWQVLVDPPRARLRVEAELSSSPGAPAVTLQVERGRVTAIAGLDPAGRELDLATNAWGELEEVWLRSAEGDWSFQASWPVASPLAPKTPAPGQRPPSWLDPALPQGRPILIGRLVQGAFGSLSPERAPRGSWIRLYGR